MSEGFSNPVSNAIGTLVRKALQSLGFVTGVTGWQITRDGNSEFNNGTFRGTIVDGPLAGAHIEIGPKLPPSPPGAGDEIRIYNGTPVEVVHIDPNGVTAGNDLTNFATANYVRMNVTDANVGNPAIEIQPGSSFAGNWSAAIMNTFLHNAGLPNEVQALDIISPASPGIGFGPASGIHLWSGAHDGSSNGLIEMFGDGYFYKNAAGATLFASLNGTSYVVNVPSVMDDIDWNSDSAGTAETWHNLAFNGAAGWSNRGGGFSVLGTRRVASPRGGVQINGEIVPGTLIDGTTIASVPATHIPSKNQVIACRLGTASRVGYLLITGGSGLIQCFDMNGTGTTLVQIVCTVYPTDH